MKQKIIRKDGIIMERTIKEKHYDSNICIRISKETIEDLKTIADRLGIKYNTMIREILEDYVEREKI